MSSISTNIKKKVCIIGLGNVGAGKYINNGNLKSLDHVSAISKNVEFEMICGVDLKNEVKYDFPVYKKISDINGEKFDLVVIATPTLTHLQIINEIVENIEAQFILIEKPATGSIFEIKKLANLINDERIFVNYHRNYNPVLLDVLHDLSLGNIQKGVVHFSNGVLNNASHGLALMLPMIGELRDYGRIPTKLININNDNFDFFIEGSNESKIYFLNTHESNYSNFRISIDFQKGVVEYDSSIGQITIRNVVEDVNFLKRKCISNISKQVNIDEEFGFDYVYNYISKKMNNVRVSQKLGVSLDEAYKIHEVLDFLV